MYEIFFWASTGTLFTLNTALLVLGVFKGGSAIVSVLSDICFITAWILHLTGR